MVEFIPVTRTKVVVPRRRAEIFSRTRLLELIDELLDNRLIIVAAPAGYGKTSLLVDFAYSTPWPVCWYSLDSLDQDPQRFIAHFIAALSLRFPNFGKSCMAALQNMSQDTLDLDLLVSLIVNDVYENITEHFILVIDDYHFVETSRAVVYFVNRFLQDADENCHLILASRTLLTLPDLTLMVARSQVGGLSFEELCFQPDEIQTLLQQNYHLSLSEAEAAELARDTEGWVTGLLLSTQVMGKTIANRARVARVSGVGLYEYLAQQVLAQQSEEVQIFLQRSSLMDEFDASLCEEVIGRALNIQPNWRELLEAVMRLNLFVLPVGEEGVFLRYHHLFLDFLRARVRERHPEEAYKIQMRLAEVYAEREEWERAYQVYQTVGDTQAVVDLLERAGASMITNGRLITLSDWLASLPAGLLSQQPALLSLQGSIAIMRGDLDLSLRLLDQAIQGQRQSSEPLPLAQSLCRRSVAYRFVGRYHDADQDADEAIRLLYEKHRPGIVYGDALTTKAIVLTYLGQLNQALPLFEQALDVYQALGDKGTTAKVWMEIGRLYKKLGKYAQAEAAYAQSLEYYQSTSNLVWQANLLNNLGVLQHTNGDYVTATSSFEKAIHYARMGGAPRLEAYALTSIGDLYQELDAIQETLEAYRQARQVAQRVQDGYLLFYLNLVEARLKIMQGDVDCAQDFLKNAQQMALQRGSANEQNLCHMEWGRIRLIEKKPEEALHFFQTALSFFESEGYKTETPRAQLYVLISAYLCGDSVEAEKRVAQLQPLMQDTEQCKLLVSTGRQVKTFLARVYEKQFAQEFFGQLLDLVNQYNNGIPALRRLIRRHAGVVPFAPPKMVIRTMGKIQVKVTDHTVSSSEWQVQTARDLFLLLLAHPEGLYKEEIGEIFWPDSSPSELKLRFKNTIYRLRHAAGKDAILFQGGNLYLFNRDSDYEYDVESFLKEISLAEKADTKEKQEIHYQNALNLYRGTYLPDLDDTWVVVERERLYQIYMDALLKLANQSLAARAFEDALAYCQRALKEDPCQEDAHRIAMRIYAAIGNRALIIRQYEQCRQALLNEVDAPPSFQTQALYKSLLQ